jgi:hypothetical protein
LAKFAVQNKERTIPVAHLENDPGADTVPAELALLAGGPPLALTCLALPPFHVNIIKK